MSLRGLAPAAGSTDSARMIDVQSALAGYQPVAATKRSEWVFGGCDGKGPCGYTSQSQRIRFFPQQQPTRMRLHIRNNQGTSDTVPTDAGPSIRSVYVGPQDTSTPANLWNMTSVDTVFTGTTQIQGLTEFVSPWYTPTYDMTKGPSLVTFGFTTPSTSTVICINNASHSILIDDYTKANTLAVGTVTGAESATAWYDYQFAQFEMWWEYEFQDDAALVGMVIGHSLPDGVSYAGGATPGWDGQNTGWPQQHGRRHKHSVIVNCYAGSNTGSWGSSSPKWNRFTDAAVDYVLISILENDIQGSSITASSTTAQITTAATTIDTNLRAMIAKIMSTTAWAAAAIYITVPVGNKPQDTNTGHESLRQAVIANLQALYQAGVIEGLIDHERAAASQSDFTTIDSRNLDGNATVANKHFSPLGHSRLADAVQITGTRNTNLSAPRGPLAFTPPLARHMYPQGIVTTAATAYNAINALALVPIVVPQPTTIAGFGYQITTAYSATGTNLNIGLYRSGPDGLPVIVAGPIVQNLASLNSATSGAKTLTAAATLAPGIYWIATALTGTAATAGAMQVISTTAWNLPSSAFQVQPGKFLTGTMSGQLPSTAIALDAATGSTTPMVSLIRSTTV